MSRSDSEHEQAILRLAISGLLIGYLYIKLGGEPSPAGFAAWRWPLSAFYLAISVGIFAWICAAPNVNVPRRLLGAIADIAMSTYGMAVTGDAGSVVFGVYLFVTFGNGFRFGKPYLFFSQALSIVGFSLVIATNVYWSAHRSLGIGLLIGLIILPLYVSTLLTRITEARKRAEEASNAKGRFLAVMSHEMRTPLNGIIGMNSLLASTPLDEEQKDLVSTMHNSAKVLLTLIENVLDISKIEAGKLATEEINFDLHALINGTAKILFTQAQQKQLQFIVQIHPRVGYLLRGDPHQLRQVLINLIGNAIKFTEKGEVVLRVSVISEELAQVRLRFEVIDTGIGIPLTAQSRIFESFTQADQSTTRRYGGTGLGTTIAKQLVELMHGEIGVSSREGSGSTFWFELPFQKQQLDAQAEESLFRLDNSNVLLLIKSERDATIVKEQLSGWGARYRQINDIASATELIARHDNEFDIAILDYNCIPDVQLAAREVSARNKFGKRTAMLLINAPSGLEAEWAFEKIGYSAVLGRVGEKPLLFNAIHAAAASGEAPISADIIPLSRNSLEKSVAGSNSRVLVAEDNATNQKVLKKILERAGYEVEVVSNGEEALDALEKRNFDIAIVDMQMPIMGGVEVAKFYRFIDRRLPRMPFVMLTANATVDAMEECQQAGIDAFLTKPIENQKLLSTIAQLTASNSAIAAEQPELSPRRLTQNANMGAQWSELVNIESLRELEKLGNDGRFIASLIDGFIVDGELLIRKMELALKAGNFEEFKDLAHGLKGSAGSIGAVALFKINSLVLNLSHQEIVAQGEAILEKIAQLFAETRSALGEYVARGEKAAI